MRRREFITLLGGTAVAWPLGAGAQDAGRTYRIGFLLPSTRDSPAVVALFDQLRLNGFVEGQNLVVIPGGFGVPNDQIVVVVASLVAASPDVIVRPRVAFARAVVGDTNNTSDRNDRGHGCRRACGFLRPAGRQYYGH
jgi:putative tryptophan/tyrosine transport system substrate-binding protein